MNAMHSFPPIFMLSASNMWMLIWRLWSGDCTISWFKFIEIKRKNSSTHSYLHIDEAMPLSNVKKGAYLK